LIGSNGQNAFCIVEKIKKYAKLKITPEYTEAYCPGPEIMDMEAKRFISARLAGDIAQAQSVIQEK
jgi:hypothetical protein